MVEARHVGHDGLLVRTGRAHNVCGGGGGGGRGGVGGGFVKLEQQFNRAARGRTARWDMDEVELRCLGSGRGHLSWCYF